MSKEKMIDLILQVMSKVGEIKERISYCRNQCDVELDEIIQMLMIKHREISDGL